MHRPGVLRRSPIRSAPFARSLALLTSTAALFASLATSALAQPAPPNPPPDAQPAAPPEQPPPPPPAGQGADAQPPPAAPPNGDHAPVDEASKGKGAGDKNEKDKTGKRGDEKKEAPFDAFLASPDDPRIPNFLRALRVGKDSLLLGAYLQPGFTYVTPTKFNQNDSSGFEFQNARLIGRGEFNVYSKFGVAARFDFDVNRGNFLVKDVYGTFFWDKDLLALDIGQMKVPFGLESIQPESKLQFAVKPANKILYDRDIGAQLRSDFGIHDVCFHLAAMVSNGDAGFRQLRNADDKFLWSGRAEIDPLGRMELDEPDLENRKFQFAIGADVAYNQALGQDLGLVDAGAKETRVGGDVRAWFRGATLRFEYDRGFRQKNNSSPAFQRYGLVGQLGYVLPIPIPLPKFELVARIQYWDIDTKLDGTEGTDYVVDDSETRLLQFGANVYFAKHAAKLMFLYQLTDLQEGPEVDTNGDVLIGDTAYLVAQVGWL